MKLYENYCICPLIDNTKELKKDSDIIRSFARMVRRKLQTCNQIRESWPMSIDDIENFVQRGPLPEHYNAIHATINPSFKVHSTEYAVTPSH